MATLLTFLFLLFCLNAGHAVVFDNNFEKNIKSYIDVSMKCRHIPGMTLAVVKGDEVWSQGFGKADIALDEDVDPDTRFEIGSVTKSFTATLLGIMLSENGLNWTAKVIDILGSGYEFGDPYRTKELTVRDLLSHRTGLARLDVPGLIAGIPKSVSRADFCKKMKYLPEEIPFRDGFIYNNYMFMMAGHVAEKLGHDTWENLLTRKVLQPVGMNDTTFLLTPTDLLEKNTAKPYIYHDGDFQNGTMEIYTLHPEEPAGAILSTSNDMAKWLKFHLNMGKTESGQQLISKRLIQDIHRATTPIPMTPSMMTRPKFPVSHIVSGYGYGWMSQEYRGFRLEGHNGGLGAYRTLLWTFPDVNLGLFASINGPTVGRNSSYHFDAVAYYIADHLLGLEPWLNETTACVFPDPWIKNQKPASMKQEMPINVTNVAELEGSYGSKIFPDIDVSSNSTDLLLTSNKLRGVLRPSSEKDRFLFELKYPLEYALQEGNSSVSVNVTFHRDDVSHAVSKLTLKLEVDVEYEKKPTGQIIG